MKRAIKIAVIMLLVVIVLGLLVKQENFLQVHYDTIEERNLERISLFGVEIKESVKWSKGGYRKQYREIFEAEPSAERWRSWPIQTTWLGTERWRSPVTPHALTLRSSVVRGIFTRYERDHLVQVANDSFTALEAILPGSKLIEEFGYEQVREKKELIADSPQLQNLEPPDVRSSAKE